MLMENQKQLSVVWKTTLNCRNRQIHQEESKHLILSLFYASYFDSFQDCLGKRLILSTWILCLNVDVASIFALTDIFLSHFCLLF